MTINEVNKLEEIIERAARTADSSYSETKFACRRAMCETLLWLGEMDNLSRAVILGLAATLDKGEKP